MTNRVGFMMFYAFSYLLIKVSGIIVDSLPHWLLRQHHPPVPFFASRRHDVSHSLESIQAPDGVTVRLSVFSKLKDALIIGDPNLTKLTKSSKKST
jgi:hypothetical protein